MDTDPNCIFCKIVRGEIASDKVYEDADVLAFDDVNPKAPVHFLLIPKRHIASLYDVGDRDQATRDSALCVLGDVEDGPDAFAMRRSAPDLPWSGASGDGALFAASAPVSALRHPDRVCGVC